MELVFRDVSGSRVEFYDAAYAVSGKHLLCCKHLLPSFCCLLALKIHFQRCSHDELSASHMFSLCF